MTHIAVHHVGRGINRQQGTKRRQQNAEKEVSSGKKGC